jgi:hypothetical protein
VNVAARLTSGSGSSSWPTISVNESKNSVGKSQERRNSVPLGTMAVILHGQAAPASSNTSGSRQGLSEPSQRNWQTFAHGTHNRGETPHRQVVKALVNGDKAKTQCLTVDQVFAEEIKKQWSGRGNEERQYKELTPMVERQQSGKLNPRWVETLMGLPIGWTMPSCTSPQTIAPTSCGSSAMELCLPPQSELSGFSLAS